MSALILGVFILGYILIALEHPLKLDKAGTALLTGMICWLILLFGLDQMPSASEFALANTDAGSFVNTALFEHLGKIAEILFFLLGAMTIVELVDVHNGFRVITDRITTTNAIKLLWIICWVTFFLSAVLDNMTTAIIMCALLRRIIKKQDDKWLFGGFVIIAANAGGAWSPIGDVTTIMLWIGGQVTTINIIYATFLASVSSLLIPLLVASYLQSRKKEPLERNAAHEMAAHHKTTAFEEKLMFILGFMGLLAVPVFKYFTHLPPYMGILLSVGILWYVTDLLHRHKEAETRHQFSVGAILHRIDTPTVLFFLGILLAVGSLDVSGHLHDIADALNHHFGNIYAITGFIGILSSIVDNVPLVAASMGMYDFSTFPTDHPFWELLAYCAGTGGSLLIIGSAAGVASMGILKIDFLWYLKRISFYALLGYFTGIGVYYLQQQI